MYFVGKLYTAEPHAHTSETCKNIEALLAEQWQRKTAQSIVQHTTVGKMCESCRGREGCRTRGCNGDGGRTGVVKVMVVAPIVVVVGMVCGMLWP